MDMTLVDPFADLSTAYLAEMKAYTLVDLSDDVKTDLLADLLVDLSAAYSAEMMVAM